MKSTPHAAETEAGSRFRFGKNWVRFLGSLNEARIVVAEQSLFTMLGCNQFVFRRPAISDR